MTNSTLHQARFDGWEPYVLQDEAGHLLLLGDREEIESLYTLLGEFLIDGQLDPEVISETDPRWDDMIPTTSAVDLVRQFAPLWTIGRSSDEIGNSLRAAGRAGAVKAQKDDRGRWYFRSLSVRGWAVRQRDGERLGRPRS